MRLKRGQSSWVLLVQCLGYLTVVSARLKVLLVGGQSNCEGFGDKFHLIELIESGDNEFQNYAPVNDDDTDIVGRDYVHAYIQGYGRNTLGSLTARFGTAKEFFGGEVGAGYVLGDFYSGDNEQPVLIVKHCEVAPLATEWRPPSSGGTTGSAYQNAIATYEDVLNDPANFYPDYDGSGVDILGFVWWHGYADAYENDFRAEYETNLDNLLQDMKSAFPAMTGTVIVELGGGGSSPDNQEAEKISIQSSVASNNADTLLVSTSAFSGGEPRNDETYVHYFGRADNYIRIGEAIGQAVISLNDTTEPTSEPTAQPTSSPTSGPTSNPTTTTGAPTTLAPTQAPTESTSPTVFPTTQAPTDSVSPTVFISVPPISTTVQPPPAWPGAKGKGWWYPMKGKGKAKGKRKWHSAKSAKAKGYVSGKWTEKPAKSPKAHGGGMTYMKMMKMKKAKSKGYI